MRKLITILLLFFGFSVTAQKVNQIQKDSIDKIILDVVERTFHRYVDSIPEQYISNYGIHNRKEIQLLRFGKPVEMFEISNKREIVSSNMWRVPALINNEYRALFTVIKDLKGEYKNVNYGAVLLAAQISKIAQDTNFLGLLRILKINKDFFIFSNSTGNQEFEPLPLENKSRLSLKEILEFIK